MHLLDSGIYIDCTVGGAGHMLAMLKHTKRARFVGMDCDPEAVAYSREATAKYQGRCTIIENDFVNLDLILQDINVASVNGILFDLGVSYHQLTTPRRGFSFEREGPLLMRLSPVNPSLRERLRRTDHHELAKILKVYGDVRNCRKIARLIIERRDSLETTLDLRRIIEEAVPRRFLKKNLHKVFQALRIWANAELEKLRQALEKAFRMLTPEGRMLVISYHSGEDRIVKHFFLMLHNERQALVLNKKVIRPSEMEISSNPSARSAKLRVIERCVS
jgi:16S rRNA (cytosine1402-N4)-methyltransferase